MESLKELVKEGNFEVSSNGISLQGVDPSFVALIQLTMRSDGFKSFRSDRNMNLGLSIDSMTKILKCAGSNDSLTLKAEDKGDSLTFIFESESGDRLSKFSLKLMDIEAENFGIPATTYKTIVQMPSSEFQRIVRELSVIGETVKIKVNKDGINFQVTGATGSGSIVCKQSNSTSDEESEKKTSAIRIKVEDEIEQTFALSYLEKFAKAGAICDTVNLMLNPEVPFVVQYKIPELGYLRYFLAPKIENEGDAAAE